MFTECGWPGALGTAHVGAGSWRVTRSQTLKTERGGVQDKGGRDAGAGVGKGLAHGRATESPCDRRGVSTEGTGRRDASWVSRTVRGEWDRNRGTTGEREGHPWLGRGPVASDGEMWPPCWVRCDDSATGCGREGWSLAPTLPTRAVGTGQGTLGEKRL